MHDRPSNILELPSGLGPFSGPYKNQAVVRVWRLRARGEGEGALAHKSCKYAIPAASEF